LLADSILHGERSVEILNRLPQSDSLAVAHGYLAEAYASKGDQSKALENFATAVALADELGLDWLQTSLNEQLPELAKRCAAIVSTGSPAAQIQGNRQEA
jgi:predicted Zn-dependent protease